MELPTRQQSQVTRKKPFDHHLLTSEKNQEIIRKADAEAKYKEHFAQAKAEAYKRYLEEEKEKKKLMAKKKKVTVRGDTIMARRMPAPVKGRSRGMGCGRARGSITDPKL